MLRIARVKKSSFIQSGSVEEKFFSEHGNLTKLIKQHLSPVTASIFATPTVLQNSDEIEWFSELKGQPAKLNSLPENEQQQAKKLLNDRLSAITRLADELPQTSETETIKQALHYPGDDAIYVMNGQPVITFWGIGTKTKYEPLPLSLTSAPLIDKTHNTRKIPRFISILIWLAALALLTFLFWYWLSKTPENWADHNPFNDGYQQLVDDVERGNGDCLTLKKVYLTNDFLQRSEEKFNLIKQQVEANLAICDAHTQLVKSMQLAEGNCPELKIILTNNSYLNKPQEKFVELKHQLERSINNCTEHQELTSRVQSVKNDCLLLKQINTKNPFLQKPIGKYIALKEQLGNKIKNCTRKELKSLPKVFGAEFVEGFATFTPKTRKRALKEINTIGKFLSKYKGATVLITLHTVVSGANILNPLAIDSGLRTTKNVLDARFRIVVNGILKVPGVARRQIKKNAYKYNRTNRIVTFTINNL